MEQQSLQPIWEVPEVVEKVKAVRRYIDTLCVSLNLFAWRNFIDDLKTDIESEIYKYEELHRQGKYKYNGIGAYCNMAKQGALNYRAFYDAKKRKANFESLSLDALFETEKGEISLQIPDPYANEIANVELSVSVGQLFGAEAGRIISKVLNGEPISSAELLKIRTPEIKLFLETYSKK